MRFRKYLSLCISISIFFQSITPLMAMQSLDCVSDDISIKPLLSTAQEVEENLNHLRKYKSSPAPLTFWGEPNKTAAGVLHFAAYQDGIYILLGKRNDEKNAWCNFGGGSDWENGELESSVMIGSKNKSAISNAAEKETLISLEKDAARESEEESNGIYTLHPRILKKIPFIDTFDPDKKMYHRMYWQCVQYVNPDVFLAKLEDAEHEHNKEYTDFKWVSADDILAAVLEPQSALGNEIYGPLLNTLSTESGLIFLTELVKVKKLNRYKPYIRPLSNRLYIFGNTATDHDKTQVKWPVIDVNGQEELLKDQKRGNANFLLAEKEFESLRAKKLFDSPYSHLDITLSPNIHETVLLSTPQEEEQLAEAVAAHGMAMVEFKKRFVLPNQIPLPNTPEWNPDCSETLSRIHLRMTLGPDYKEPMSCSEYLDPQRQADIENIKLYFSRHKEAETGDKFKEFKREITLLDSDYEFFANVLDWETKKKIWPTFYHGASANVNNLFTSFTYLRQLINIDFNNGSLFLRGTDIYSHGIQSLRDFIEKNGKDESDLNRSAMLFMNFVLFAGLKTTNSTSSSAEYVLNDHSVQEVVLKDKFEEAMALAGFSNPHYGPFQSLYEQFKGHKNPERGNSVLIAISQNPEGLDDYNYPTGGGGEFWRSLGSEEPKEMPSSLKILQDMQAEHMRQSSLPTPEPFTIDTLRKRALYPENRIYLEPKRMSDPNKIHIRSFDRFQLTREESAIYDHEMRRASVGMASDWLAQKSTIMEGSFASYPALKRLHKFVHQGLTGHPMEEKLSPAGFIHLVRHGQLDGVKQFLDCFPNVLEHKGLTQQKLIEAASDSQNPKLMQYLVEDVFKTNLQKTLGLDALYLRIRRLLYETNPKNLPYLLSQFDSASIPDQIKLLWIRLADSPSSRLCILNHIQQSSPHLTFNAIEHCFKSRYVGTDIYKVILDANLMTSQELLVKLYDRIMKKTATQYHETIMPLQMLLGNGADLTAQHPLTQTPLAFLLPELTDYLPQEITSLLEDKVDYLKLVNKEGLTLLQAAQKKSLETQRTNGLLYPLIKLCQKVGLDYKTESYIPFIEYFGPTEYFPHNAQEFLNAPESLAWIQRCQQATSGTVADLINTCPYSELLACFEGKLSAFGLSERYTKRSELDRERDQWMIDTQRLLSDKTQLAQHLLNALSVNLRRVLYLLLNESYVDILPSVLERIYPTRKDFLVEKKTEVENGSAHCTHPIIYTLRDGERKNVVECLLSFLGEENIPQFLSNLQEYDMYSLLAHFPESKLLDLYESTPSIFIQVTEEKNAFKKMLGHQEVPLSLKRKIAMEHIEKLKTIENFETGFPYFWHIFFSGEKYIPLMKELIEQDSSLLSLKSIEGFTIQQLLSIFPKVPEVMAIQRFFSNSAKENTILEYLPDHKVVYSFREIWEELLNKTIHLWSDIDEVMIYDKHFWRYNSLKSFIPRESHNLLGEYDHALLDEDAPEIFKMILKNNGRICGLTARPPESSKFESTYRRLSQSGLAFDGAQGMETIFTKEKFSHFDRDIFYCGDRDKGEVVLEAIDALYGDVISDNLPLFVFTDDLMENLIAISETLKDTRYKFVLYHFRGIDHKLVPYMENPDLVRSAFQEFRSTQ